MAKTAKLDAKFFEVGARPGEVREVRAALKEFVRRIPKDRRRQWAVLAGAILFDEVAGIDLKIDMEKKKRAVKRGR